MSSLFSLDNILLKEENINSNANGSIINLDNIGYEDTNCENFSFVQEGYKFILEMNRDVIEADKFFYASILESYGDTQIINEAFGDFFKKIKEIIKKFIDWVKKIFKQFITKIAGLFKSDKYLNNKKNRSLLFKFSDEHEFEFKGYKFTKLGNGSDIPKAKAVEAFNTGENELDLGNEYLTKPDGTTDRSSNVILDDGTYSSLNALDHDDYKKDLSDAYDKLRDGLEDFYDSFRGTVIGKSNKIASNEYADELFKVFRDDEDSPEDITINSSYVHEAYTRFNNYKDIIKAVEKNQKEMIKDYEALEKFLDKMINIKTQEFKDSGNSISGYYSDLDYSGANDYTKKAVGRLTNNKKKITVNDKSVLDKINEYVKLQSTKVSTMCQIHTQAFTARLEAEKAQYKQDKAILYKALNAVIKKNKED